MHIGLAIVNALLRAGVGEKKKGKDYTSRLKGLGR